MNHHTDEVWRAILATELENIEVLIHGNILTTRTIEANIKSRWEKVKNAIGETNRIYVEQRRFLVEKIQERDKQQASEQRFMEQAQREAQKAFDELEL